MSSRFGSWFSLIGLYFWLLQNGSSACVLSREGIAATHVRLSGRTVELEQQAKLGSKFGRFGGRGADQVQLKFVN